MENLEQIRSEYYKAIDEYHTALDEYFASYRDDDGEAYAVLKQKAKKLWEMRTIWENQKEPTI